MTSVREDVHIHAPAETVFGLLADLEGYAAWLPKQFREVDASTGELGFELAMPFRPATCRLSVRERTPPRHVELRAVDGYATAGLNSLAWSIAIEGPREVHVTGEAGYASAGALGGLLDLLLLRGLRRQALRDALWLLKQRAEGTEGTEGTTAAASADAPGVVQTVQAVQAVVFDLDGVLVDSEPVHRRALDRVLATHGAGPLTDEDHEAIVGTSLEQTIEILCRRLKINAERELLGREYIPMATAELRRGPLEPLDGARELLEGLRARELPLALASQSHPDWIAATLDALGLRDCFRHVVSAHEVPRAKPWPDIYLRAAELLGVPPGACLAIEDSAPGVASARAAGMTVVQLRQAPSAAPPQRDAHAVIEAFEDFDEGWLDRPPNGSRPSDG